MSKVRVASFSVSLDGFGAGPEQSLENPMGAGGMVLHEWAFGTQTFKKMMGREGGSTGVDERFAARGFANVGAWILGRNMFGPVRGPWLNEDWKGWWGDTPPYHVPVFVLTHQAREPLVMLGGTTFYFVTEGIEAALAARGRRGEGAGCAGRRRRGDYSAIFAGAAASMRCIWRFRRSCWGAGKIFSRGSICRRWGIRPRSGWLGRTRRMW